MRIAAIDLGSNSFHMLIADILGQSFETLLKERMTIQLGKAALVSGRLDPEAMERGMRCIGEFRHLALARQVERTFAVATSAIREAENGEEFIHRIGTSTGIAVRAISGREEARLIYLAVKRNIDFGNKNALLIDIGGGSVELTVADSRKILFCTSQKPGFLRLHASFVSGDPMSKREERSLKDFLASSLSAPLAAICRYRPELVIATSGMATTLLRVAQRQEPGAPRSMTVKKDLLVSISENSRKMKSLDRAKRLNMDLVRSEYFPTALLCLNTILEGVGARKFLVSPYSLREGLVYDFLSRNKIQPPPQEQAYPRDMRYDAVLDLAARCGYPREHSHRVALLGDQIFRQTKELHGLGENEARLLRNASILHDIGYHIAHNKHHKHGSYLVMNGELRGFTAAEREMVAQLVRYHRGAKPKPSHPPFAALPAKSRETIKYLSAILRIADSLDRSHSQLIEGVRCARNGDTVQFQLFTASRFPNLDLDLYSAKRNARYFEKVFGFSASFVASKSRRED
jgi:exopolyphosphatase/guanosine-5'-triphosphate,3'-diphosphate pyrophosphatase